MGSKGKLLLVLAALVSAGFVIAAVVTFLRVGDWPAKYLYVAATILLFVVIALKRRARRDQAQ
jgi:membrane protein implicated in regulation of membrane protease activity